MIRFRFVGVDATKIKPQHPVVKSVSTAGLMQSAVAEDDLAHAAKRRVAAGGDNGFPNPSPVVVDAAWCIAIEADSINSIGDITHLEHLLSSRSVAE